MKINFQAKLIKDLSRGDILEKHSCMRNTYCLSHFEFITEYPNAQYVINTQI
jgi:hypothetical protein